MKICACCGKEYVAGGARYCSQSCANRDRRRRELEGMREYSVFSCGAGVQSAALAAMICDGKIPLPDFAVMVDTGYEKTPSMQYAREVIMPRLAEAGVALEIIRTRDYYPKQTIVTPDGFCVIPAFVKTDGKRGVRTRTCCNKVWKTDVVRKYLAERGAKRYRTILGISADESQRMRRTDRRKETNEYPLVLMGMDRAACVEIIQNAGWPVPTRSSCVMCGMMSDRQWMDMRDMWPEDFEKAVQIEREIHRVRPDIYLHKRCMDIDRVFIGR